MIAKLLFVAAALVAAQGNAVGPASRQGELNTYYLYTKNVPVTGIPIAPSDFEVDNAVPELISALQTIVIVHGHSGDAFTTLNPTVKNAFLLRDIEVNIIVVDWSTFTKQSYSNAVGAVPGVGTKLGEFLALLVEKNRISLSNLHLIGFNLGAHVVGFAGRTLGGEVARITGLDPSGSQWGSNTHRLSSSDAKYVEVIHTDGDGVLANGVGTAIGDVDFFVNGGGNQPGCLTHACSHNRAWDVFAATLVRGEPLNGYPCGSNLQLLLNTCRGFPLHMGDDDLYKLGQGIYRVNTKRNFPY